MAERLYKATELAEILNCNPQTIYRMAYRGEIESVKHGSLRRFLMPEGEQNDAHWTKGNGDDPTD